MENEMWKTMESAPKDGTWILIYGDGGWYEGKGSAVVCWFIDQWLSRDEEEWEPSHWMPLPPAPEAAREAEDPTLHNVVVVAPDGTHVAVGREVRHSELREKAEEALMRHQAKGAARD